MVKIIHTADWHIGQMLHGFERGNEHRDFLKFLLETMKSEEADALVVGSPVYYGQPNGAVVSLIQRLFFSAGALCQGKPAAAVAVCRRGGATSAFQTMCMPFMMMNMTVVGSQYWNIAYGREPGQAALDTEGMQTMRTLGRNLAWVLKKTHAGARHDAVL